MDAKLGLTDTLKKGKTNYKQIKIPHTPYLTSDKKTRSEKRRI